MAKEKKQKTEKLPKKIAGVKVPKELRKAGKTARELAQSPIVGEAVSAALLAAAASLTNSKVRGAAKAGAADLASGTAQEAGAIGQAVKQVLIDAARNLLDNFEKGAAKQRDKDEPTTDGDQGPARSDQD